MVSAYVTVLTLPQLSHFFTVVLSMDVRMWDKASILGAKICTCAKSAASLKSLIVISPLGFVSVTSRACVSAEKGEHQTNH